MQEQEEVGKKDKGKEGEERKKRERKGRRMEEKAKRVEEKKKIIVYTCSSLPR